MTDKLVPVSPALISLGAERALRMNVDAGARVPLESVVEASPRETGALQTIDLDTLRASLRTPVRAGPPPKAL